MLPVSRDLSSAMVLVLAAMVACMAVQCGGAPFVSGCGKFRCRPLVAPLFHCDSSCLKAM